MAKEPVFYSFHFDNDVFRVQQIRNMGVIEGNEPVSANEWEQLKRAGIGAVERWIDKNMKYKRCVVVLIGSETADRPWVQYEIKKAWRERRGLLGVYIHSLKCPRTGTCVKGPNPFDRFTVGGQPMANLVEVHDPSSWDAYGDIARNMQNWVASAIASAQNR
jgi:antiphage defense system Thoeris ThsB-like protein